MAPATAGSLSIELITMGIEPDLHASQHWDQQHHRDPYQPKHNRSPG
jgi:hypothetical protein